MQYLTPSHRPTQRGVQEWKASISIRSITENPSGSLPIADALAPHLCYTCHTAFTSRSPRTMQEIPTSVPLPIWTSTRAALWTSAVIGVDADDDIELFVEKRASEGQMHNVIKEFLLDE